jgi:hypothetical protein
MPDHLLNASTIWSCTIKTGMVDPMRVASSAYHLLDRVMLFEASLYPFCVDFIHRMRGLNMYRDEDVEGESRLE